MTGDRNALTVDVVTDRMSEAERLLSEARERVQGLAENAELASRSSGAISEASESLRIAAGQLTDSVASLQAATSATTEAMDAAATFLASTDLSSMAQQISALEASVQRLTAESASRATQDSEFQARLEAQLDRTRELEAERDALRQRLQSVMEQIPSRVAKKIT